MRNQLGYPIKLQCELLLLTLLGVVALGCTGHPAPPDRPAVSAGTAASEAIAQLDSNSDGSLDVKELTKAPGLRDALPRADQDGDEALSEKEIADRIAYYEDAATIISQGQLEFYLNGRRLTGATVTLTPEPFLGEAFSECTGETDSTGVAYLSGHDQEFPGIYLGMYQISVSKVVKGKEMIPARYNSKTTLGYESCDDRKNVMGLPKFNLRTK